MLFDKVCDAVRLIDQYNPARFARLKRDLRGLWITETGGNHAEYHYWAQLCVLDRSHLLKQEVSAVHVASIIVHEATHARLFRAGFGYEPEMRVRIERVCFKAEIAFASRLPDGQALIEQAHAQLQSDPVVWTREAFHDRAVTKLRELRAPKWLIRLYQSRAGREGDGKVS